MNANYGLFPPLGQRMRGRDKKQALGQRALAALGDWILETGIENSERVLRTSSC
jgi:folate-dependent tRNA-U54 methylase TrmFO/GidA